MSDGGQETRTAPPRCTRSAYTLGPAVRKAPGDEAPRTAAKSARNRGLAAHLARARELQALVESGRFASIRAIGKHEGLSGTRVSQLLGLLDLHPDIVAAIDMPEEEAPKVKEKELRVIARMEQGRQMREWRRLRVDP